eukprot:578218-Amphidinium_carterae.1
MESYHLKSSFRYRGSSGWGTHLPALGTFATLLSFKANRVQLVATLNEKLPGRVRSYNGGKGFGAPDSEPRSG